MPWLLTSPGRRSPRLRREVYLHPDDQVSRIQHLGVLAHHAVEGVAVLQPVVVVGHAGQVLGGAGAHAPLLGPRHVEAGGEGVVGGVGGGGGAGVGGGGEAVLVGGGGQGLRGHVGRAAAAAAGARAAAAPLLLGLHPPVLEPDLDLALGQAQAGGQLEAARAAEVAVVVVLLLQLHQLPRLEGGAGPLARQRAVRVRLRGRGRGGGRAVLGVGRGLHLRRGAGQRHPGVHRHGGGLLLLAGAVLAHVLVVVHVVLPRPVLRPRVPRPRPHAVLLTAGVGHGVLGAGVLLLAGAHVQGASGDGHGVTALCWYW